MSDRYLVDLADVCRAAGLQTFEVDGWQSRARSSGGYEDGRPVCVMWHHTASNTSAQNDVAYIVDGSPDAPLSNLYLARDGSVHVCAAGCTNTNGKGKSMTFSLGTVPADSMNTWAIGVEAANDGVGEAWSVAQVNAYFALSAALTEHYGMLPDDLSGHAHYAPDRKIDPAVASSVQGGWQPRSINTSGTWALDDMRHEAIARAVVHPPPPQTGEVLMFTILNIVGTDVALGGNMDGNGIIAQVTWLNPSRYEACVNAGADVIDLSISDLSNCDLLGPLPPGFDASNFANVVT